MTSNPRGGQDGNRIPVLTYHGLNGGERHGHGNNRFWVTESAFAAHLAQIKQSGLACQTLAESRQMAATDKRIALTFDDGRASDYHVAFRVLMEAHCKADFFLNTSMIGQSGFLTWPQVGEMHRAGMSIQSHGHEHVDHSTLALPALKQQLRVSKHEIEDRISVPVKFFAAPYGEWNQRMVEVAREIGYEAICTTEGRLADCSSQVIDRIGIDGETPAKNITAMITRDPAFFAARAMHHRLKRVPKRVVMQLFPGVMKAWRDRHHG